MAMAEPSDGYGWAIVRVTELEVELAGVQSRCKRSQADHEALLRNHTELTSAHMRLQEQQERFRQLVSNERQEHKQIVEEHQKQTCMWQELYEGKVKELEKFQQEIPVVSERAVARIPFTQELEESQSQQIQELERKLSVERHNAAEERRKMEAQVLREMQKHEEDRDRIAEMVQKHELSVRSHQRRELNLEAAVKSQEEQRLAMSKAHVQAQEQEVKILGLQEALQEHERCHEASRKLATAELLTRTEELNLARRRTHDVRVELEASECLCEQMAAEIEALKLERAKSSSLLVNARNQLVNLEPNEFSEQLCEELAHVRRQNTFTHEETHRKLNAAEDCIKNAQLATKRALAHNQKLEDELEEREREFNQQLEEIEEKHAADRTSWQGDLERSRRETDARFLTWCEKEADLTRQVQSATARADDLSQELLHCQCAHQETQRCLRQERHEHQQRFNNMLREFEMKLSDSHAECTESRERADRLDLERRRQGAAMEAAREDVRKHERRCDELNEDFTALSERLDVERIQWTRAMEDAHVASVRAEEERRNEAMQRLADDHRKQITALQTASKRALQKGARKRQELRQKCQEMAKRIVQLQQVRSATARSSEQSKGIYEPLADVDGMHYIRAGLACNESQGASSTPATVNRNEMHVIMERLEQDAERLLMAPPALRSA